MRSQAWDITVEDSEGRRYYFTAPFLPKHILEDTVFYDVDMTEDEVKRSLIDHDCYPSNITVRKGR